MDRVGTWGSITLKSVLGIILPYCAQWQSFHLDCSEFPVDAFMSVKGNLPLLEELCLDLRETPNQMVTVFEDAPKLHYLTFRHGEPDCIAVPWAQLARYDMGAQRTATYLSILPKLTNLVEIELKLSLGGIYIPLKGPTVLLPRVAKLEIDMYPNPSSLLDQLTLPSLMEIRHDTDSQDKKLWDLGSVKSLIIRSGCCITSLALPLTLISITEAKALFNLVPELTRLESNDYSDDSWALFERAKGTNQTLLPKLKVLRMDFVRGRTIGPAFMKTIISRWVLTPQERELGAVQLERFIYLTPTNLDQGDLRGHLHRRQFLTALEAQGLDVKFLEVDCDYDSDDYDYRYGYNSEDNGDGSDSYYDDDGSYDGEDGSYE